MKRYVLSPEARGDLLEIWEYIARDNIDAADRIMQDIRESCSRPAEMPEIGHYREDLSNEPLKFWRVHSYLIVYRPSATFHSQSRGSFMERET